MFHVTQHTLENPGLMAATKYSINHKWISNRNFTVRHFRSKQVWHIILTALGLQWVCKYLTNFLTFSACIFLCSWGSVAALSFISFNFENSLSKFSKSPPPVVRLASSWMSRSNMGSAMRICHTVFMYVLNIQNPTAMSPAWTQVTTERGPSTGQLCSSWCCILPGC